MTVNYESPMAKVIDFEAIDIITLSVGENVEPTDTPEVLSRWGKSISEYASADIDLFK